MSHGLGVWLRVQGSELSVQGSGLRVPGTGSRLQGPGFRAQGSGLWFIGAPDLLALPNLTVPLGFPATWFEGVVEGPGLRVEG